METDGVNLYSLTATLQQKNLDGLGYSFYELTDGSSIFMIARVLLHSPDRPEVGPAIFKTGT